MTITLIIPILNFFNSIGEAVSGSKINIAVLVGCVIGLFFAIVGILIIYFKCRTLKAGQMHPSDDLLDDSEQIPPPSLDHIPEAEAEGEGEGETALMDTSHSTPMDLGSRNSSPLREYTVTHSPKSKSRLDIDK